MSEEKSLIRIAFDKKGNAYFYTWQLDGEDYTPISPQQAINEMRQGAYIELAIIDPFGNHYESLSCDIYLTKV